MDDGKVASFYFYFSAKNVFNSFETAAQSRAMEQHALKNVNNCLNTSIYSYLETSGGQISNPYLRQQFSCMGV
jgi:hypothetical protein